MTPTTRGRLILVALTLFIVYFLFLSGPSTAQVEAEFRRRTEEGIAKKRNGVLQGHLTDEELTKKTNQKLQAIIDNHPHYGGSGKEQEKLVPDQKNVRYGKYEDSEPKKKDSVKDQPDGDDDDKYTKAKPDKNREEQKKISKEDDEVETGVKKGKSRAKTEDKKIDNPAKDAVREKLQEYLKRPVVIFSKTFCPHSKNAKKLLTEVYKIVPPPLIVEIDRLTEPLPLSPAEEEDEKAQHPIMGPKLQELLHEVTGRRTVPNIMVGMHSIGGNDLIWDLHKEGKLADLIRDLAGKRVSKVELNKEYKAD